MRKPNISSAFLFTRKQTVTIKVLKTKYFFFIPSESLPLFFVFSTLFCYICALITNALNYVRRRNKRSELFRQQYSGS